LVKDSSFNVLDASIKMAFKLFESQTRAADSAELFRVIVEGTGDHIIRLDRDGRYIYCSPSVLSATEITCDQYMGKTHREPGFPEQLCLVWKKSMEAVVRTALPQSSEFDIELHMQNDELREKQAELETLRQRYFDLFDLAPASYFNLSETGRILEADLAAARLVGVVRDLLINRLLNQFIVAEAGWKFLYGIPDSFLSA